MVHVQSCNLIGQALFFFHDWDHHRSAASTASTVQHVPRACRLRATTLEEMPTGRRILDTTSSPNATQAALAGLMRWRWVEGGWRDSDCWQAMRMAGIVMLDVGFDDDDQ